MKFFRRTSNEGYYERKLCERLESELDETKRQLEAMREDRAFIRQEIREGMKAESRCRRMLDNIELSCHGSIRYINHEPSEKELEKLLRHMASELAGEIVRHGDVIVREDERADPQRRWSVALKVTFYKQLPPRQERAERASTDPCPCPLESRSSPSDGSNNPSQ